MAEPTLDLTEAIEAASLAIFHDMRLWTQFTEDHRHLGGPSDAREVMARVAVAAAAPVIARAVREQVARDIEAADVRLPHGVPIRAVDLAAATKDQFAAIARGGRTDGTDDAVSTDGQV